MDEEVNESSGANLVVISLAILAIVLGGAGLYFGLTANQRLGSVTDTVEAGNGQSVVLEKQMETLNIQITELSGKLSELEGALGRLRTYGNASERAIKELGSNLKANREQILKLTDQVVELGTRSVQPKVAAKTTTTVANESSSSATPASGTGGTYTIEPGDYFSKIAKKTGVSLQAIIEANPDVDSRRLSIGQVINLPSE